MDVTALLNRNTLAIEQHKENTESLRLPTRSRTPWDAGGYSLPIHTATPIPSPDLNQPFEIAQRTSSEPIHGSANDSRSGTIPTSPTHWFSDSRSSISSASSVHSATYSATHSRFSSFSTINSNHSLGNNRTAQSLSPKATFTEPQLVMMSTVLPASAETQVTNPVDVQARNDLPQTKPLDTLAIIAESQHVEALPESPSHASHPVGSEGEHSRTVTSNQLLLVAEQISEDGNDGVGVSHGARVAIASRERLPIGEVCSMDRAGESDQENVSGMKETAWGSELTRPASPSDTLLIKRTNLPSIRDNIRKQSLGGEQPLEQRYPRAESGNRLEELSNPKRHKRALSAPNFALQRSNPSTGGLRSRGRRTGHTPPPFEQPDRLSPPDSYSYSAPGSPPSAATEDAESEPVCMYIEDCDTGSQQRKAISHIFGRNKMCTRLIPQHVWVHLCRKHYQRSRYRNATAGYAKVQCDLVQEQIRRIHDWSERNQENGRGPFVENWTLALRKREQKRIEEQDAPKRKRANPGQGEDESASREEAGFPLTPQTAVPDWLLAQVGGEFSTRAVLDIFSRLHQHIIDYTVPFPDIELLPNVVLNKEDEKKVVTKSSHQRAQSLSINHESSFRDHAPKRRKQNEALSLERNLPPTPRMSRRPTYADINEHEADGTEYSDQRSFYQTPFSGPMMQRRNSQAVFTHTDPSTSRGRTDVRPTHHRAHSDMGNLSRNPFMYSSRYPEDAGGHVSRAYQPHGHLPEELGSHAPRSRSMQPYDQYPEDAGVYQSRGGHSYGTASVAVPFSDARVPNKPHSYHVMDPLLPGVRDMKTPPGYGHSRHYSSPAIPRPSYSMPYNRDASQSHTPRSTYVQGNKLTHSISEFREPAETYDFYNTRR